MGRSWYLARHQAPSPSQCHLTVRMGAAPWEHGPRIHTGPCGQAGQAVRTLSIDRQQPGRTDYLVFKVRSWNDQLPPTRSHTVCDLTLCAFPEAGIHATWAGNLAVNIEKNIPNKREKRENSIEHEQSLACSKCRKTLHNFFIRGKGKPDCQMTPKVSKTLDRRKITKVPGAGMKAGAPLSVFT